MAIFDESNWVKNPSTLLFEAMTVLDAPYRIQLTGTLMHHSIDDWVIQTRWLFSQCKSDKVADHGPRRLHNIVNKVKRGAPLEETYADIKKCVSPWTIHR